MLNFEKIKNTKISDIFSKIGDRKSSDRKYVNGCIIIAALIIVTITYLIITNIKWILLGITAWVMVYIVRQLYLDWVNRSKKENGIERYDEYVEL